LHRASPRSPLPGSGHVAPLPAGSILRDVREYGHVIMMIVPCANDMKLYQPTHKPAYNL
jgi:hypothetical protein